MNRNILPALIVAAALVASVAIWKWNLPPTDSVTHHEIATLKKRIEKLETDAKETHRLAQAAGHAATVASKGLVSTSEIVRGLIDTYLKPEAVRRDANRASLPSAIDYDAAIRAIPTQSAPPREPCQVLSVSSRVTETASSWLRYGWILRLSNTSTTAVKCRAEVRFKDASGYIIDTDTGYNLVVPGFSQAEFSGNAIVRLPGAENVKTTDATVRTE